VQYGGAALHSHPEKVPRPGVFDTLSPAIKCRAFAARTPNGDRESAGMASQVSTVQSTRPRVLAPALFRPPQPERAPGSSYRKLSRRLTSAPRLPQRVAYAAFKSPFCFGISCPRMGVVGGVRWNYEDRAATRHLGHDRN
jgi:hypothetical protein